MVTEARVLGGEMARMDIAEENKWSEGGGRFR